MGIPRIQECDGQTEDMVVSFRWLTGIDWKVQIPAYEISWHLNSTHLKIFFEQTQTYKKLIVKFLGMLLLSSLTQPLTHKLGSWTFSQLLETFNISHHSHLLACLPATCLAKRTAIPKDIAPPAILPMARLVIEMNIKNSWDHWLSRQRRRCRQNDRHCAAAIKSNVVCVCMYVYGVACIYSLQERNWVCRKVVTSHTTKQFVILCSAQKWMLRLAERQAKYKLLYKPVRCYILLIHSKICVLCRSIHCSFIYTRARAL